jgi:hypothetical protein
MDDTVHQQEQGSNTKLNGFSRFLHWLVSLIRITDEEQHAAGIYFGNRYDNEDNTSKEK